jgi:hypothetical protein
MLYHFCRYSLNLEGDVAECGVYRGTTAELLCQVISERPHSRRLYLFDTFRGMPESVIAQQDCHTPAAFADTSLDLVKERLQQFPFVAFCPGVIPEVFQHVSSVQVFSFVHVDVANYRTVLECCDWFWPRLCLGGSILLDDYGFYAYRHSVRAAVDEFFSNRQEIPIALHTGQALVIKTC